MHRRKTAPAFDCLQRENQYRPLTRALGLIAIAFPGFRLAPPGAHICRPLTRAQNKLFVDRRLKADLLNAIAFHTFRPFENLAPQS
jgi:hypothetical protein